jgi:hypothetical protein
MKTKSKTTLAVAALQMAAQIASVARARQKRREAEAEQELAPRAKRAASDAAHRASDAMRSAGERAREAAEAAASHAQGAASSASELPQRAIDQLPSRRRAKARRARRTRELEIMGVVAVLAIIAAIVAIVMRREARPLGAALADPEVDASQPRFAPERIEPKSSIPARMSEAAHNVVASAAEQASTVKDGALQTAQALASGSSLATAAATNAAKVAVDEYVTGPAKAKAIKYGSIGAAGLAALIIISALIGAFAALAIYDDIFGF